MAESIDLKPIQFLHLENLIGMELKGKDVVFIEDAAIQVVGHSMVAKVFNGTDVYLNPQGYLESYTGADDHQKVFVPLSLEATRILQLKKADRNQDSKLDRAEVEVLRQAWGITDDANTFFEGLKYTVANRWSVAAKNMIGLNADLRWKPTLDALRNYSQGILLDEVRHAHSTMPLNGLSKTGLNILASPVSLWRTLKGEATAHYADNLAAEQAQERHAKREKALSELEELIAKGTESQEDWALDADLSEALKKLSPESVEIFKEDLPAQTLHKILSLEDGEQRRKQLLAFAKGERPSFLGYGGGNTDGLNAVNIFNYTGRRNNLYFAKSVLASIARESDAYQTPTAKDANETRIDMLGEGGNYTSTATYLVSNLLCRDTAICQGTPWRSWGDETSMDAVGRALDFGLVFYGSFKGSQLAFETLQAPKGAWQVMRNHFSLRPKWLGGKGIQPFPGLALRTSRLEGLAARQLEISKFISHKLDVASLGIGLYASYKSDRSNQRNYLDHFNPFETNDHLGLAPYPDLSLSPEELEKQERAREGTRL